MKEGSGKCQGKGTKPEQIVTVPINVPHNIVTSKRLACLQKAVTGFVKLRRKRAKIAG